MSEDSCPDSGHSNFSYERLFPQLCRELYGDAKQRKREFISRGGQKR